MGRAQPLISHFWQQFSLPLEAAAIPQIPPLTPGAAPPGTTSQSHQLPTNEPVII